MQRRYDLDWLRVIAFALLIMFHTGMMFSNWNWSVKNLETSASLSYFMTWLHEWRMPLLFFISGSAVWFAMDRYSTWRYFLERQKRLLLPLVFGMLVVIPPQIYFERLYFERQYDSFLDFYRGLLPSGPYPEGNISWHHLWYVPYIWAYSMVLLPFCVLVRTNIGRSILTRVHGWLEHLPVLFLIFIPSAISDAVLRPIFGRDQMNLISDWANFTHKLTFFAIGFLLASGVGVYDVLAKHRRKFLVSGLLSIAMLSAIWTHAFPMPWMSERLYHFISNLNVWMWILAALGHARYYLNFNNSILHYSTDAVYPFYILHQTITVAIAYYLVYLNWSWPLKFAILATGTFVGCWVIYEYAIRPWNLMRVAFGMKWKSRNPESTQPGQPQKISAELVPGLARSASCLLVLLLAFTTGCSSKSGKLVVGKLSAPSLSSNRMAISDQQPFAIYLPPSYDHSNKRYPVLYILPNFGTPLWRYTGGDYQGFRLKDSMDQQIKDGKVREMIVVIPNAAHCAGGSWYRNSALLGNWEDYIVHDVLNYVEANFRTLNSASSRGLAGHGMGGYGALELALKHPDVFGSVYAMSPAVFASNGLRDSGIVNEGLFAKIQTNSAKWASLDPSSRRHAFRDYLQQRLNSSSREHLSDCIVLSYAAAVSCDPAQPFPHLVFPTPGSLDRDQILRRYEDGFGGWAEKIASYKAKACPLRQITIEYGKDDEFQWIRRGSDSVSALMQSAGVTNTLAIHDGGHDSQLGNRLVMAMLPTVSQSLRGE